MIPSTVREYRFEKHSYKSRFFPDARWIATIDCAIKAGLLIKCLHENCLIASEDLFFEIEIIPIRGLERVDYVSEDL